jgi:hypothetical protein
MWQTTKGNPQIGNIKIEEEPCTFNINNKSIKFRSHWKLHILRIEGRLIPNKLLTHNQKRRRAPAVKMEGPTYSSRGRKRPIKKKGKDIPVTGRGGP